MRRGSLFAGLPGPLPEELIEVLLEHAGFRLERIVSTGQATPPGEWCAEPLAEWVVLLRGSATLRFEDDPAPLAMAPGDWVEIPAHARHRVERTDAAAPTVWFALHHRPAS